MLDKLKYAILLASIAGAVAVLALPFAEYAGRAYYATDARHGNGYILLGEFAAAALLAVVGIARGFRRWQAILCVVCLLLAGLKSNGDGNGSGQTVALFAAFVGMLLALVASIRPERRSPV